jgi:hypothetical protein
MRTARQISAFALEAEAIREKAKADITQLQLPRRLVQLRDELYTALVEDPPSIRSKVVEFDTST